MPAQDELRSTLDQLHTHLQKQTYNQTTPLLSRAKLALLHLNALIPTPDTPRAHLLLARETLELGALLAIRQRAHDTFTRYFQQLQPFYALPESVLPAAGGHASKITGLYLLQLLSQSDYLSFHMLLETLESEGGGVRMGDKEVQYPVRLEQALMEGSYDRVWGETKGSGVPDDEFRMFSEVLIPSIRHEIASCSERAYASVPMANAKNLFFLDSEGAVAQFAKERGWSIQDGRIYFPNQEELTAGDKDIMSTSGTVIENTLGYARELETIV
ncbi:hypothetical protein BT63DRAFT_406684 [Microthyrium microscopicum]|uniref:CSN8/PSMD8/EIF3K domain-containing protein n=1 Tax=Microthyrium microscopicum TaxID=703497 RepID=A0A6A6TX09_9PEZI|nr:hypothetical protein BT63DRAFT_406684 [Microthyrium microscopicum]